MQDIQPEPATPATREPSATMTPDVFTKAYVAGEDMQHATVQEWIRTERYTVVRNDALRPGRGVLGGPGYIGMVDFATSEVMWSRT